MRSVARRHGFTLIEVLVALGVIGLLASLLLPAVQSSREAAHCAHCANNLRQLGIAMHSYESAWGMFPPAPMAYVFPNSVSSRPYKGSYYSAQSSLLLQLEEVSLHDSINFSAPTGIVVADALKGANGTAATQAVSVFLCPSDAAATSAHPGSNNYRANAGICGYCETGIEDGAFTYSGTRPASFSDGLSSTLAFSEKLVGGVSPGSFLPNRDWIYAFRIRDTLSMSADGWVDYCGQRSFPSDLVAVQLDAGRSWMLGGTVYTEFLVSAPPNTQVPDCGQRATVGIGVFAARSLHPGGVNAVMADGSARFFTNGIDGRVWRALGTRNGAEVFTAN